MIKYYEYITIFKELCHHEGVRLIHIFLGTQTNGEMAIKLTVIFINQHKPINTLFPIHEKIMLVYYLTKFYYFMMMIPLCNNLEKHISLHFKAKS